MLKAAQEGVGSILVVRVGKGGLGGVESPGRPLEGKYAVSVGRCGAGPTVGKTTPSGSRLPSNRVKYRLI